LDNTPPFQNANKRTAFVALVIFLRYNGYSFEMEHKAAEDWTVDMVNHKYSLQQLAETIDSHCRRLP